MNESDALEYLVQCATGVESDPGPELIAKCYSIINRHIKEYPHE